MKEKFFILVCIFVYSMTSLIAVEEKTVSSMIEKIVTKEDKVSLLIDGNWVDSEEVRLTSEGVFLLQNNHWELVSSQLTPESVSYFDVQIRDWVCLKCGTINRGSYKICDYCMKYHSK